MNLLKIAGTQIFEWVKENDLFGHVVNLNFDKSGSHHKTLYGGLYSIFIRIFLAYYLYLNLSKIYTHKDDNNVTTSGMLDVDALGDVDLDHSSMKVFIVIKKLQYKDQNDVIRYGQGLENYLEIVYT